MATNYAVPSELQGPGETYQVGGNRFALFDPFAFSPVGLGSLVETGTYATPSIPPTYAMLGGGNSVAATAAAGAQTAASNWTHPTKSTVMLTVVALVVAVVGLHWLHWGSDDRERK